MFQLSEDICINISILVLIIIIIILIIRYFMGTENFAQIMPRKQIIPRKVINKLKKKEH